MSATSSPASRASQSGRRISPSSTSYAESSTSNQRLSCEECQKRKSKCDKQLPCSVCRQRGIECTPAYLDPNKPRKKRFPERELLDRIQRYEALLSSVGIDKDSDVADLAQTLRSSDRTVDASRAYKRQRRASLESTPSLDSRSDSSRGRMRTSTDQVPPTPSTSSIIDPDIHDLESILETVSPLKTPAFHMPSNFDYGGQPSHASRPGGSSRNAPQMSHSSAASGSDLAVSSTLVIHKHLDLMFQDDGSGYFHFDDHCPGEPLQHPSTSLMFRLLHLYEQNIHSLIRVIHMPSVRERLCDISANPASANAQDHALLFAIYTITVGTLTSHESERLFGPEDRKLVWERYRRNAQTALCRADVWRSSNIASVQAYLLYLLTLCKDVDPRAYGIFTGSLARMVQRLLSLHSKGVGARIKPVNQEMAIRLWWEILACDMRACEKSGISSNPTLATATLPLPRNASDADLEQLALCAAPSADAFLSTPNAECLFLLLRSEIAQFQLHPPWSHQHPEHHLRNHPFRSTHSFKRLFDSPPRPDTSTLAWRLSAVDAFDTYIAKRFFDRPEAATSVLIRYAHHHARQWIMKVRLFVHLNQRSAENDAEVIRICVIQVEETAKLIASTDFVRYQWYTYQQLPFFSFVILLDLLRRHTTGPLVERAWEALEQSSVIWRPEQPVTKGKGSGMFSAQETSENDLRTPDKPATPNIFADWADKHDRRKLVVRGTMLAALMVAAWEKRVQALAAEAGPNGVPEEPAIVSSFRSAAIKQTGFLSHTDKTSHEIASQAHSHTTTADQQAAQDLAGFANGIRQQPDAASQWTAGMSDSSALMAFLDPSAGTSGSATVDDMLNLNSLLQSSVDLDWSGWVNQSWGTPAGMPNVASPANFIPSL